MFYRKPGAFKNQYKDNFQELWRTNKKARVTGAIFYCYFWNGSALNVETYLKKKV